LRWDWGSGFDVVIEQNRKRSRDTLRILSHEDMNELPRRKLEYQQLAPLLIHKTNFRE
jgi:hypothetical protein